MLQHQILNLTHYRCGDLLSLDGEEEHGKDEEEKCDEKIEPSMAPFWGCRYFVSSFNTPTISRCASSTIIGPPFHSLSRHLTENQ
jgi:hypothetical protein